MSCPQRCRHPHACCWKQQAHTIHIANPVAAEGSERTPIMWTNKLYYSPPPPSASALLLLVVDMHACMPCAGMPPTAACPVHLCRRSHCCMAAMVLCTTLMLLQLLGLSNTCMGPLQTQGGHPCTCSLCW